MTNTDRIRPLAVVIGLFFGFEIAAATVRVNMSGMKFGPTKITIQSGDTVEFVNTDPSFPHTVTADPKLVKDPANVELPEGVEPFNSGTILKGASFSKVFTVPGNYKFACLFHERMGMIGEVEVVEKTHLVGCHVDNFLGASQVGPQVAFQGEVTAKGGIAISKDFEIGSILSNLHVYYIPETGFASINYFHAPTDTALNTDTFVQVGKDIRLFGRTRQIAETLDSVSVSCRFQ